MPPSVGGWNEKEKETGMSSRMNCNSVFYVVGNSSECVQACGVVPGHRVTHNRVLLRGGQRLNREARISLVLSSRLLYLRQCGECMRTGNGMETSQTLSLNDSWNHPGRERDIKYWQGLCVLMCGWRNVCAHSNIFLLLSSKCCLCVFDVCAL